MDIGKIKNDILNAVDNSGEIDQIQLAEQVGIVSKIASTAIGVMVVLILVLVPIITALEIMYISFPIFRAATEKSIVKLEKKGILVSIAGITFRDARYAVEQAETTGEGVAMMIYIKEKTKSITFVVFIIALIFTGASTIIDFVWSIIEGFTRFLM